ncbi:hypothetical protein F5Y09DRAFT_158661 [Xylaria sp. FL1042]|nr:hypothetical protein F5Y09DRAFT_158661 [Xylaria sp. FL1042]
MSKTLPRTGSIWLQEAQLLKIENESIHESGPVSSGSQIERREFLLLRIIWPKKKKVSRLYSMHENNPHVKLAKSFLNDGPIRPMWEKYIKSIQSAQGLGAINPHELGTFSLVRYHQLQTKDWNYGNSGTRSKVDFSPIAGRTRSQTARDPTTPTRASTNPGIDALFKDLGIDNTPPSGKSSMSSPFTPLGQGDTYYPPGANSGAVVDEQIVNTALIEYLNALAIHYPELEADWTLHRLPLIAQNGDRGKTYEARIDGYLRRRDDGMPLVILEVKPYQRSWKRDEVRMQEGAQMAAWINRYPPRNLENMRTPNKKDRRLLISQDRDEIYLTFAEFDADYVDYVCHKPIDPHEPRRPRSFLTMTEYGPFDVGNRKAMKKLGELVLGLALGACREMLTNQ